MKTLKINSLFVEAFRSFKGKEEIIDLPSNGLVGIIGINKDTGGSNGAGKSNFHLAIEYGFNYSPCPATELQNNATDTPMQVCLGLVNESDETILLKRGEETSIVVDGKKYNGARTVEQQLKKLIPVDPFILEFLTFRAQRSFGKFLTMTDSEKKELLSNLLGLKSFEDEIAKSKGKADESQKTLDQLVKELDFFVGTIPVVSEPELEDILNLESDLSKTISLKADIDKLIEENDEILSKFKKSAEEIVTQEMPQFVSEHEAILKKASIQLVQLYERQKILRESSSKKLASLNKDKNKLTQKINELKLAINEENELRSKIDNCNEQLACVRDQKCSQCSQQWIADPQKEQEWADNLYVLEQKLAEIKDFEATKKNLEADLDKISISIDNFTDPMLNSTDTEIELLTIQKTNLDKLIKESQELFKKEFSEAKKTKLNLIRNSSASYIEKYHFLNEKISKITSNMSESEKQLHGIKISNELKTKTYNKELLLLNSKKEEVNLKTKTINETLIRFNSESDFLDLLKTFLNKIMEEVLTEISNETNSKLAKLANVCNVTIQFLTENVTQKGNVRQEIKPIIFKNGTQVSNKSGLSDGQFSSLEWAIDLSIASVISRRTGFMPGWLVLDEPFNSSDLVTKENCLALLKEEAGDRLIFVIDHSTETKEMFDRCIIIESKNDVSIITNENN